MSRPKPSTGPNSSAKYLKQAATFGAAASALAVSHAPAAEAAIIDLTPTLNSQTNPFCGPADCGKWIDPDGGGPLGSFFQYNDTIGKTFAGGNGWGFRNVQKSQVITAGLFKFTSSTKYGSTYTGWSYTGANPGNVGIGFVGFHYQGQLGWLKFDLGGETGPVHFLAGAYNNVVGESIHVPEPATISLTALGLLAMGARGVRRYRNDRRSQTETSAS